jgi:hypothetical protein
VLIVGGRQSAYEWAALLAEHRAERIDLVHRHDVPRFERVSWQFVDPHMEATMRVQGWWRTLPKTEQDAIARQFWEVGRLTLEYWLTPRLASKTVHRWPGTEVVHADTTAAGGELEVRLSKGEGLLVDHVIFACGYRADLPRVPYLAEVLDRIQVSDGFPVLDEAFGTSLPGLYLPGFTATRDLGPFFGSSSHPGRRDAHRPGPPGSILTTRSRRHRGYGVCHSVRIVGGWTRVWKTVQYRSIFSPSEASCSGVAWGAWTSKITRMSWNPDSTSLATPSVPRRSKSPSTVTSMPSTGTAKAVAAIWHDRARGRGGPGLRLDRGVGRAVVVHPGLPAFLRLRTIE